MKTLLSSSSICCSVPPKLFSTASWRASQSRRNRSTNLRMMPLFPSLQWNERGKTSVVLFYFAYFFKRLQFDILWSRLSCSHSWSRQWRVLGGGLCCGLVTHSVIVLWEVVHLPQWCALKMMFVFNGEELLVQEAFVAEHLFWCNYL